LVALGTFEQPTFTRTGQGAKPYARFGLNAEALESTMRAGMHRHVDSSTATSAVRDALGTGREELLAFVRRRGHGSVDPEEVLHVAFQRALERAEQVRDPARAEAWVSRVVRNVLYDELRKRQVPVVPVDELELAALDEGGDIDCWCVLVQAEQLKPEYAMILRRVILDGVPVTRVAAELGLTPNNAMVRLHRARAALKKRLESHCGTTSARSCSECGCQERGCCPRPELGTHHGE
jgi:DNA-directed RNA polymerase specialized sigma24 family protein